MQLLNGDKYHIISAKWDLLFAVEDYAFAFKYEDFMLPRMLMQWAIPIRFYFKQSHSEVGGAHIFRDEPPYFHAVSPASSVSRATTVWAAAVYAAWMSSPGCASRRKGRHAPSSSTAAKAMTDQASLGR